MDTNKPEEISEFFDRNAGDYESMHLSHVHDGIPSKNDIARHLPEGTVRILDLGAGTGLELDALFERFPNAEVTVVDISEGMLARLKERFPDRHVTVVVSDYFSADFGPEPFDAAISSMTMHHWLPEEKQKLYRRIHDAVKPGGMYVENDYMLTEGTPEQVASGEGAGLEERRRLDSENPELTHVHMDLPLAVATETQLLKDAGFVEVTEVWRSPNNVTLQSRR